MDIDDILSRIGAIWQRFPHLRLGQLICNVIADPALYYVEDEKLLEKMEEYYYNLK